MVYSKISNSSSFQKVIILFTADFTESAVRNPETRIMHHSPKKINNQPINNQQTNQHSTNLILQTQARCN